MTTLNADAAAAIVQDQARAATDVTGFGLVGHLSKMMRASGVAATVDAGAVPLLPGVLDLAQRDVVAGGTKRNHASVTPTTDWGVCALAPAVRAGRRADQRRVADRRPRRHGAAGSAGRTRCAPRRDGSCGRAGGFDLKVQAGSGRILPSVKTRQSFVRSALSHERSSLSRRRPAWEPTRERRRRPGRPLPAIRSGSRPEALVRRRDGDRCRGRSAS